MEASLIFKDGSQFLGEGFGYQKSVAGELVFNTGMMGYPETMTDPSYAGQIIVLTYPLIGNYGIPNQKIEKNLLKHFESRKIFLKAIVVSRLTKHHHWAAETSLQDWMKTHKVAGIQGIDTRMLTKKLRTQGSQLAQICFQKKKVAFSDPNKTNLVSEVSITEPLFFAGSDASGGSKKILLLDTGCKHNIIRSLLKRNLSVEWVPWDYDFSKKKYDGLMLGNGPGNPDQLGMIIERVRECFKNKKPIFGICLGHQIIAKAAGAKTYKMTFGHRSYNQPCIEIKEKKQTNKCLITSQNHGFAVAEKTIPKDWQEWFVNANDGSNEGIKHNKLPFQSVQFHPEATPGPTDSDYLFDTFANQVHQAV